MSLGVDATVDDPESPLRVTCDGFREAGLLLGAAGLPTVVVQEGGYHLPTLGGLVAAYLDGHATHFLDVAVEGSWCLCSWARPAPYGDRHIVVGTCARRTGTSLRVAAGRGDRCA